MSLFLCPSSFFLSATSNCHKFTHAIFPLLFIDSGLGLDGAKFSDKSKEGKHIFFFLIKIDSILAFGKDYHIIFL